MSNIFDIVEKASITEKSSLQNELYNKIVFRVKSSANKIEIKQAIEHLFNVKVASIKTSNIPGKKKRVGAKSFGKTPDWKKAYVTLAEGKINFLDEL